jgi:hypothetical protein
MTTVADHDLEDGVGFVAVRCPTDDLKNGAWRFIEPRFGAVGSSGCFTSRAYNKQI